MFFFDYSIGNLTSGRFVFIVTELLLEGWDRKTPLLCAVFTGSESCVHALLRSGARADVTDEGGNTPLHIAAIQGDYPTVRLLSKAYTDVDIFNSAEFTPLHLAARHGHLRTVRYLILAGADPGITSRTGITPDVMAFAQGYAKVGMLLTKMKPEKRTAWIEQLKEGTHRFPRIKVKIFGSSLVGKTQLTHSLLSGPISAYLKKKLTSVSEFAGLSGELGPVSHLYRHQYPYIWNIDAEHENYTQGINVHITNEYSLWDFSGFQSYYCFYDHFIGDINCIHLVLFNLMDTLEWRRKSVRFWLDFLHARIPVTGPLLFGGRPTQMARVILVGTHADVVQCQKDPNGVYYDEEALQFIKEIISEYEDKLDIHEFVYLLDARDGTSTEMKQLKTFLADVRNIIVHTLPRTNTLMLDVSNKLSEWTVNDLFPICNLDQFAERIHENINPLCTDEHLFTLIEHLQYAGNIVYIEAPTNNTADNNILSDTTNDNNNNNYYNKNDMIVLDPNRLCNEILGRCLSERFLRRTRITGSYTLDELQLFVREQNTQQMIRLLESFGLCVCCIVKEHRHVSRMKSRGKKHSADCFELFEQINSSPQSRTLIQDTVYTDPNGVSGSTGSSSSTGSINNHSNNIHKLTHTYTNDSSLNNTQILKPIVFDISRLNDTSIRNEDIQIEMPRLNLIPLYQGLWDNNDNENKRMVYSGVQLIASPGQFIHLMPRIQVQLRREISMNCKKYNQQKKLCNRLYRLTCKDQNNFSSPSEVYMNSLHYNSSNIAHKRKLTNYSPSWNLVQWLHGSKISDSKGEIQVFICIDESKQVLEIRSRCLPQHTSLTFGLLHETIHLITQVISRCCPNLNLDLRLINSDDLTNHRITPKVWDTRQLIQTLLLVIAQNSNRSSLGGIDLQIPRTPQKYQFGRQSKSRLLHEVDDNPVSEDDDDGAEEEEEEGEEQEDNEVDILGRISRNSNLRLRDRKSLHSLNLQNQLIKDLFFNNKYLSKEVSNYLLDIPSYPLPVSILQKLAKCIDIIERDPSRFDSFIQYLCYPDVKNLFTQWNQGICLWGTLSPTVILLNFASKYPIRILEWALLSSYGLNMVQMLYTSYILLNFCQVLSKQQPVKPSNNSDSDYVVNNYDKHMKCIRSSSTPRDSQL
uniref:Roc domain-containing protein n=1 Tax=Trichobilharzia regenti TaxID=157069 RepID=A0AA85JTU8_TRIRE|nr:unnamed protein product [Trichobilharzia regenti]